MIIKSGDEQITIRDVLIGDVWICSGQSNMEFLLTQVDPSGEQSESADLPQIRLLTVRTRACADRQSSLHGKWILCEPETIANFSAVGGWFGRELHGELDVPIGLIANAWGGTRIQAWISREALVSLPDGREEVSIYERLLYGRADTENKVYPDFDSWFRAEGPENPEDLGRKSGWETLDFDDTQWPRMDLPRRWQDAGHKFNGIFWFRRTVEISENWQGQPLNLHLGAIDKHDETYVNGVHVGGIGWENPCSWSTPREYQIPAALTENNRRLVIAVRVRSHQYHGGMRGPHTHMNLQPKETPGDLISLAGEWSFAVEQNWGNVQPPVGAIVGGNGPGQPNAPYTLFNSRISPLIPYAIRGWLWYQGESNGEEGVLYRQLLPLLIEDWRRAWGQGNSPFLLVQLANYQPAGNIPHEEKGWVLLRDAQFAAGRLPHVGVVTAIDVGDADDVHPRDKKTVGLRLARWALVHEYGRAGLASGPTLRGIRACSGGRLRLTFENATGLCTRDGDPVRWLAIAGPDRHYRWAASRIDGEALEVWHDEIPHPVTACYAWAQNPEGCNLVNAAGLPAFPFETDRLP